MLQSLKLVLPVLIPSWQFFNEVAPSPRIEFTLREKEGDEKGFSQHTTSLLVCSRKKNGTISQRKKYIFASGRARNCKAWRTTRNRIKSLFEYKLTFLITIIIYSWKTIADVIIMWHKKHIEPDQNMG